ncbi:MAG: hypothetical protein R6X02_33975 [Enhygromyxa sp.]
MNAPALTIDRVDLRVRLPESQLDRRAMLERVRERVLQGALEAALAAEGLLGEELVCVRSVAISLRLDPRAGERAWIDRWVEALTRDLQAILREGDPQRVIRYPSPRAALADMARSVARGDLRRAWAWAQLGLGDAASLAQIGSAREQLLGALLRRPELIVAVLGQLARAPAFAARLLGSVAPRRWSELAAAALRAHGIAAASAAETVVELATGHDPGELASGPSSTTRTIAERSAEASSRSPLATLARRELARARERGESLEVPRALAVLALLEAEPMRARRVLAERGGVEWLLASWASRPEPAAPKRSRPVTKIRESAPALRDPAVDQSSSRARPEPSSPAERSDQASARTPSQPSRPLASDPASPAERSELGNAPDPTGDPRSITEDEAPMLEPWRDEPLDARARGRSEWAGLLLLIPVLRRDGLYSELDAIAEALALDFRALLHAFGRALVPASVAAEDPALLGFVGLTPDADPPTLSPEQAGQLALSERFAELRTRLIAALEARLAPRTHRPSRGEALLAWLLRRRGELIGEPGWLELHLELREVDTDIRRAGLDLNPDWVPELGAVLRFVYV